MFLDKESALKRNSDFISSVSEILRGDRSSVTSQGTLEAIQKTQLSNAFAVENTYVTEVFPMLMGKSRTVKHFPSTNPPGADQQDAAVSEIVEHVQAVVREFAEDRLHREGPCYFVKDLLFGPRTQKEVGISDPRPDIGFGIKKKEMDMDPPKLSIGTELRIRVAGCLEHCFCIIEAKGPDDPFAHAVIQALRGGITLVRARRDLKKRAGYTSIDTLGADQDSWVFTIAWMHGHAEVYICWHETLPDGLHVEIPRYTPEASIGTRSRSSR